MNKGINYNVGSNLIKQGNDIFIKNKKEREARKKGDDHLDNASKGMEDLILISVADALIKSGEDLINQEK